MKKVELIAAIAEKTGATKKETAATVDAFVEVVKESLANGEDVRLVGFGTFTTKEVAEKTGTVNFESQKGKTWTSPAHKVPKFKAGKDLKDAVA